MLSNLSSNFFVGVSSKICVIAILVIFLAVCIFSPTQVASAYHGLDLQQEKSTALEPGVCKVKVIAGTRLTRGGTMQVYTLYMPEADSPMRPPYPAVMLIHGFLMTGAQHRNNAQYLAEHGFLVLTPNISKWLWGEDKRMRNVDDLVDVLAWLAGKTGQQPEYMKGMVDTSRIGIGGNSSGGAAALEVAIQAQKEHIPLHALVSLDGVPWDRTADLVHELQPLKLLTLRAEDCLCNYHARMLRFLDQLTFPYDDVKVLGAHHCDVENPTTLGCYSVCGKSDNSHRMVFQNLIYLYFKEVLDVPHIGQSKKSFKAVVQEMQSQKQVVVRNDVRHGSLTAAKEVPPGN